MMKRLFNINKILTLIKSRNGKSYLNGLFNISSVFFLGFIFYRFYFILFIDGIYSLLSFLLSLLFSFLIFYFISCGFRFSNNVIIKYLQCTVFWIIFSFIICFSLPIIFDFLIDSKNINVIDASSNEKWEFNTDKGKGKEVVGISEDVNEENEEVYKFSIKKNIVDKALNSISDFGRDAMDKIVPNLGAGAAAGKVASQVFKSTAGTPPLQRLAVTGGSALVTAAGTVAGLQLGMSFAKNALVTEEIKKSNLDNSLKVIKELKDNKIRNIDAKTDNILDEIIDKTIKCPLENNEISRTPLEDILFNLNVLNVVTLILIILLIIIMFNIIIYNSNRDFIKSVIDKIFPNKIYKWNLNNFKNKIKIGLDKSAEYNKKFMVFMLIINSFILILFKLISIYSHFKLINDLDDLVMVYNYFKFNKNSLFLICLMPRFKFNNSNNLIILKDPFIKNFSTNSYESKENDKDEEKLESESRSIDEVTRFKSILESTINDLNYDDKKKAELYEINNILLRLFKKMELVKDESNKDLIKDLRENIIIMFNRFGLSTKFTSKIFKEFDNKVKNTYYNENTNLNIINDIVKENLISQDDLELMELNNDIINEVENFIDNNVLRKVIEINTNLPDYLIENLTKLMIFILRLKNYNENMRKSNGHISQFVTEINKAKYFDKDYDKLTNKQKRESLQGIVENKIKYFTSLIYTYLTKISKDDLKKFDELTISLRNDVINTYANLITSFFEDYEIFNYERNSMLDLSIEKMDRQRKLMYNINFEYRIDEIKKLNEIRKNLKSEIKNNKFQSQSKLFSQLSNIVNNKQIDPNFRQLEIERILIKYENEWFKMQMSDNINPSINSIILHDIYKKIEHKFNTIINKFMRNNFEKLLVNLNSNKEINKNEGITVLLFIYLGKDKIINICFNYITSLLFNNENINGINRTNLIFKIADRLFKTALSVKLNEDDKNISIDLRKLFKILPLNEIILKLNNINEMDKFYLGDTILNIILKECNIFESNVEGRYKDKEIIINISANYRDKLARTSITYNHLPMLVPAQGLNIKQKYYPYLTPEINHVFNPFDTIIKNKYDNLYPTQQEENINKCIIFLNNVKFKINTKVYNLIVNEWENKDSKFFKGYNILQEINENDSKVIKREKMSHNSKYWYYHTTIVIATLFLNSEFYIPTFADFRGRIYPLINYLSYQGDDLNRSLLLFVDVNDKINKNGREALFAYFANLSNHSKESWNYKLDWSMKNHSDIISTFYLDRNNFNDFIDKLDEPFQFISIMFALEDLIMADSEGKDYISNNPILFDATCNGIQHLSALTREIDLALKVNLVTMSNKILDEKPQDFYEYAASLIKEEIKDHENKNFRNINLNRSLIKKTVMTIPYNISLTGVGDQLNEFFPFIKEGDKTFIFIDKQYTFNNETIFLTPKEYGYFTKLIFNVLTKKMPSLNNLTEYLNNLIKILLKLNKPIIWITPSGLKISLSTMKFENVVTKTKLIKSSKPVTISLPTNELNKIKIKRSFMPNLIHSLDASNIHLLITKLINSKQQKIQNIYTIHDCFATTANEMKHLDWLIKCTFIDIYFKEGNYLEKMHNNILDQILSYVNYEIYTKVTDNIEYVKINNQYFELPQIPKQFISDNISKTFIEGIMKAAYFIK